MNIEESSEIWNKNAVAWTELTRAGYDAYRDGVHFPAFIKMLPDVNGLKGLDIGCGEGFTAREMAKRGAKMYGIDVSEAMIRSAVSHPDTEPFSIDYQTASATELPFDDASFDFCVSTMAFMDFPHQEKAIAEAYRVLKRGGFFQLSMLHPCFHTPMWKWNKDESGRKTALICGDYFNQPEVQSEEWMFSGMPSGVAE